MQNKVYRLNLAQLPTPVHELKQLSGALGGPEIWVKRDDQTGLALGGNKVRKLEFLVGDALRRNCDTLITAGGPQSNHCRQTAAAAARHGLKCELVLGGNPPPIPNGNLLLDLMLGANLNWTTRERRNLVMEEVAEGVRSRGGSPYLIPVGGSNGLGCLGYALAIKELCEQLSSCPTFNTIVVASSSGGTQAGMVLGARLHGLRSRILGISIDNEKLPDVPYQQELARIANEGAELIGAGVTFQESDFEVEYGYLGGGYGVLGDPEREAITQVARLEGLFLDPVYSGRAMGALVDLIRKGAIGRDESVLFWHTGGCPALFDYAVELLQ